MNWQFLFDVLNQLRILFFSAKFIESTKAQLNDDFETDEIAMQKIIKWLLFKTNLVNESLRR